MSAPSWTGFVTGIGLGERRFEVPDRLNLHGPEAHFIERRKLPQTCAELLVLRYPLREGLDAREREELAAPGSRIESIGEIRDGAVGLEQERKGTLVRGQVVGQAGSVLGGLCLHAG